MAASGGVRRSRHQIMNQINEQKTYETLAAINEMLLITQNYLVERADLFETKGVTQQPTSPAAHPRLLPAYPRPLCFSPSSATPRGPCGTIAWPVPHPPRGRH